MTTPHSATTAAVRKRQEPKFWYRFVYFVVTGAFLLLLYQAPVGLLAEEGDSRTAAQIVLWCSVVLCALAYLAVQGSDPGYIPPSSEPAPTTSGAPGLPAAPPYLDVESSAISGNGQEGDAPPIPPLSLSRRRQDFTDNDSPVAGDEAAPRPRISGVASAQDHARLMMADADPDFDGTELRGQLDGAQQHAENLALQGQRDCRWCKASQPARAHHCRSCNACVAMFDHHCTMLGTCIGERNRCRFWWLLLCQSVEVSVLIGILNTGFVFHKVMGEWVAINIVALVALLALWLFQVLLLFLLALHCWLAATNTTTFETAVGGRQLWYLAGTDPRDCDLPFSSGVCANLRLFCCRLDDGCLAGGCWPRRPPPPEWRPWHWNYPGRTERDSPQVWGHCWENAYWSCC